MQRVCSQYNLIELKNFRFNYGHLTLSINDNSSMYFLIYDVLEKLIPAGIPQYLMKYHDNVFERQIVITEKISIFKILCLNDLYFVFILWIHGCGFAVIVMLVETKGFLIRKFVKKVGKRIKSLIV